MKGFPLEFRIGARDLKSLNDGRPDGRKSFKIDLVVLIQYRLWQTDTQPASQPRRIYRAYYVARVKKKTSLAYPHDDVLRGAH